MIIRRPEPGNDVRPGEEKGQQPRMTYFWTWFNVLTMGLVDVATEGAVHHDEDELRVEEDSLELNMATLKSAETCLKKMREAAYAFVREDVNSGWSSNQRQIGLFFHCYPHCSVNSLHLHIVDLSATGPTYHACEHTNLPIDFVLNALDNEIKALNLEPKSAATTATRL